MQRQVQSSLATRGGFDNADVVRRRTGAVLEAVATLLGDGDYLFGAQPSSGDALLFGLLSAALHTPLPAGQLRAAVQRHANLSAFVERVQAHYFRRAPPLRDPVPVPQAAFAAWDVAVPMPSAPAVVSLREKQRRRRNFFTVVGAVVLLGGFYVSSALFSSNDAKVEFGGA